ncbi:MAG: type IV pilin-like G/H family protein [Prochlorothrix sp.]
MAQSLPSPIFPTPIEQILPTLSPTAQTETAPVLTADRLAGSWQWQSEDQSTTIYLTFDGVDRVVFRVEGAEELQLLSELLYQVDLDPDPWSLDLILSEDQAIQTIFRFGEGETAADLDRLELELTQLSPGQPRPLAFGDSTLSFDRLGEAPPLPEGAVLLSYEEQQQQRQEGTALSHLNLLAQAQGAYYQDGGTFGENWQDFVLGIVPETATYRYGVEVREATIVALTAQAKGENTRSYSGLLVATEPEGGEVRFSWQLCATAGPSQVLPPVPEIVPIAAAPANALPQLTCAPGSVPLGF